MQSLNGDIQPSHIEKMAGKRIVSVNQVPQIAGYQWLSKHALRHLIFAASPRYNSKGEKVAGNGLEAFGVIIRLGRKVLIDLDALDKFLESHREISHD